jgi:hypothetical protein
MMNRMTQEERVDLYNRTLCTMTFALDALADEPDPDGTFAELAYRIGSEREWVRTCLVLGEEPRRPMPWPRRTRGRAA